VRRLMAACERERGRTARDGGPARDDEGRP